MKKIIVLMMMMLVASVGYGQVSNKKAAMMFCESVPLKKYNKKVCEKINVRINVSKWNEEAQAEIINFFRDNGINCHITLWIPISDEDKKNVVDIRTLTDTDKKIGITELDFVDLMGAFNFIYKSTKEDMEMVNEIKKEKRYKIDEKCDDVYAIQEKYDGRSYGRVRERDYAAEGAWRFSVYRLTGNPSWLAW